MHRFIRRATFALFAFTAACFVIPSTAHAVERTALNSVNAELAGPGLLYSVNYERIVVEDLGIRAGLSYWSISVDASSSGSKQSWLLIPVTASYLGIAGRKSALEIGGGFVFVTVNESAHSGTIGARDSGAGFFGTVLLGYRYQPAEGGFQFRIGISPLIGPGFNSNDPKSLGVFPWGYMSFGGSF